MKQLEDFRLPEVGSEKVKVCMQKTVERALQWQKDNGGDDESHPITVDILRGTFRNLSDCDFENEECINKVFKMIIDRVFEITDEDEVLEILNDAYAIAIHAMNTDYPEYKLEQYCGVVTSETRNVKKKSFVISFAANLFDVNKNILNKIPGGILYYIDGFNILISKYRLLYEDKQKNNDITELSDEINLILRDINEPINLHSDYHPVEKLLDAMVRYAENFTANEWSKKRVIGHMIHAKGAAGRYFPYDVYQKYEKRIDDLANFPEPEQTPSHPHQPRQVAQVMEPQETHATAPAQDLTEANASNSPDATPPSQSRRGRRAKSLFSNPDVSGQQAALFLSFLESENLKSNMINCEQDNEITASFLCFCDYWKNAINGFKFAAAAGARFLAEDCALSFDCGIGGYENILRTENEKARKPHWKNKVENFLNKHC